MMLTEYMICVSIIFTNYIISTNVSSRAQGRNNMVANLFLHTCWGIQVRLACGTAHSHRLAYSKFRIVRHAYAFIRYALNK